MSTRPISAGDRCRVIQGLTRGKSPNIGVEVIVGRQVIREGHTGDHPTLGRIVHCTGEKLQQMDDAGKFFVAGWAHLPVKWLERIEPDAPPPSAERARKAVTA